MITTVATGIGAFGSRWSLECDGIGQGGGWSVTRSQRTATTCYFDTEREAREYFAAYTTPIVEQRPTAWDGILEDFHAAVEQLPHTR